MRRAHLAAAGALLVGCSSAGLELDPGASADMQRCGVDIRMSSAFRIELQNDARDKRLSAATVRELKSTIFDQVPEASKLAVYESYVDCITSRRSLASALNEISARKTRLASTLRSRYHVPETDVRQIEASYDKEADELRSGRIIAARETRTATVYDLALIATRNHLNLDRETIIATGGSMEGDRNKQPAADPGAKQRAAFVAACRPAADERLCQSIAPAYEQMKKAAAGGR